MRRARERMLCIVSPGWPGGVLEFGDPCLVGLQALFDDLGVIHFAAVALLPPRPGEPAGTAPSLMLELAVDEGLRPQDLLHRLAHHPSGALWDLYSAYWPGDAPPEIGSRNEALRERLERDLSVADGAYVGPRDLSVAQVRRHRQLADAMTGQASRVEPALRARRDQFALALARWAFSEPAFEAIAGPSPRSYWRSATGLAKLRMFATRAALLALGLALLAWCARCVRIGLSSTVVDEPWSTLKAVLRSTAVEAEWLACTLLGIGGRALLAAIASVVVGMLLFVLLPGLWPAWRRWLEALNRTLDSPGSSIAAGLSHVFGLLLLPWCLFLLAWLVAAPWLSTLEEGLDAAGRALAIDAALVVVTGLLLAVGLPRSGGASALGAWFTRTRHETVPGAQQVHRSVDESDARLVGGTAHLISLTEMRAPRWWSVAWTRFFLRVVTFIGHILFTEGRLGDLRGIQFGHWHVIDGGRRYLFCSNFDGNFGGYLDDFIKGASGGTTLFWRWTRLLPRVAAQDGQPAVDRERRFPPTRLLAHRGVKCEQGFKAYARASMLPHLFRYDATGLSGAQKIDDRRLRDALFGERNDANDDLLMRTLER